MEDSDALLTYRIGPVYCCGPSLPIITITPPPRLTQLPGASIMEPGVFKHGKFIVAATDLRYRFGVKQENWKQPGQVIIVQYGDSTRGYYVDEIIDVIRSPRSGWGNVPVLIPRGVFSRTLLLNEKIFLYAEFEKLSTLQGSGYLAEYIAQIEKAENTSEKNKIAKQTTIKTIIKDSKSSTKTELTLTTKTSTEQTEIKQSQQKKQNIPKIEIQTNKSNTHKNVLSITSPAHIQSKHASKIQPSKKLASKQKPGISEIAATAKINAVETKKEKPKTRPAQPYVTQNKSMADIPLKNSPPLLKSKSPNISSTASGSNYVSTIATFLIFILLSTTGYYFYSNLNKEDNSTTVVTPMQQNYNDLVNIASNQYNVIKPIEPKKNIQTTITSNNKKETTTPTPKETDILNSTETSKHSDITEKKPEYHASIRKQENTITIELNGPQPPSIKNSPRLTKEANNKATTFKEIEPPHTNKAPPAITNTTTIESAVLKTNHKKIQNHNNNPMVITHIIVKGDTLWAIAKHYLQNPFLYPELAKLSKIENPDLIYPGNRVRIIYHGK